MDYSRWVERLRSFVLTLQQRSPVESAEQFAVEIAPPLDEDALEKVAEALDCGLPPPLRRFLGTAASSVSWRYVWPPPKTATDYWDSDLGLPLYDEASETFCPTDRLVEWREGCLAAAPSFESDFPLDRAFWRHALPLTQYPDTDGLALWLYDPDHDQPAVIYLAHEEESFLLSRTFDEFLEQWEKLGYTSAGCLNDFRNPKTGFLDARTPVAVAWRKALGLVS